jgi:hypothetical protein
MKRLLLIPAFMGMAFNGIAQDQSYSDCVVKVNSAWGEVCEKCEAYKGYRRDYSGTFRIDLKNACNDIVEVKVAVQEASGTWRTFPIRTLAAGQTTTAFACNGTGKYLYWVRRLNDTEIILPSDQEILTEYRDR